MVMQKNRKNDKDLKNTEERDSLFPCFSMLVKSEAPTSVTASALKDYCEGEPNRVFVSDGETFALIKFDKKGEKDYTSPSDYAKYAARFIYEETGKKAKIFIGGKINEESDIESSISEAKKISEFFRKEVGEQSVHTIKERFISDVIKSIPEKERAALKEKAKEAEEVIFDKELYTTAIEFLRNDLNVCETARKLFVHRNTLNYRLNKIEKKCGLDLRRFTEAVTFYAYIFLIGEREKDDEE